jgi:hypothetical protein
MNFSPCVLTNKEKTNIIHHIVLILDLFKESKMKKYTLTTALAIILCSILIFSACPLNQLEGGNPSNPTNPTNPSDNGIDTSLTSSYEIIAAPQPNSLPIIMESATDGKNNYYLLDIGIVNNVLLSYGDIIKYTGQTPLTVEFKRSSVTEKKVEESVSRTVSESIQETDMNELGGKFGIELDIYGQKIITEINYSRTWGTTTDKTNSTTNTYTTANSIAKGLEKTITYTVGEHGEAVGFYRLSLFAACDIYFFLKTNIDNSQLVECTAIMCARPNHYFALEYDAKSQDFNETSGSDKFVFAENYYKKLPLPKSLGDIVNFAGGSGAADNPYLISTQTHLNNVRNFSGQKDTYFKLNKSIDLQGSFEPIATLNGTFDGNNHEIRNMNISKPAEAIDRNIYLGLFGTNAGTIKNVKMTNPKISVDSQHAGNGWIYAGAVCGENKGLISDVTASDVNIWVHRDKSAIGGIAGTAVVSTAIIKNCQVTLSDLFGANGDTGGIIGQLQVNSRVEDCKVLSGTITHYSVNNTRSVGGIVGICDSSKIIRCAIGNTYFEVTSKQQKPAIGILCGSLRNGSETNSCSVISDGIGSWGGYKTTYYRNKTGNTKDEDKMFKVADGAIGEQKGTNIIKQIVFNQNSRLYPGR